MVRATHHRVGGVQGGGVDGDDEHLRGVQRQAHRHSVIKVLRSNSHCHRCRKQRLLHGSHAGQARPLPSCAGGLAQELQRN